MTKEIVGRTWICEARLLVDLQDEGSEADNTSEASAREGGDLAGASSGNAAGSLGGGDTASGDGGDRDPGGVGVGRGRSRAVERQFRCSVRPWGAQ